MFMTGDKITTLCLDAMSLSVTLRYMRHIDHICGFEDVGSLGQTSNIANQTVVAMSRSVHRH